MNLQTRVEIKPIEKKISYRDKIMFAGSCFTENIAERLSSLKFQTDVNPMGIVYNPVSLLNCFEILHSKKEFTEKDIFIENGLWKSYFHHSRFNHIDRNECLKGINERITLSSDFIKHSEFLFITLGTAWVFEQKSTGKVVSNCHKSPATDFTHRLLTVDEAYKSLDSIIEISKKSNPDQQVIFTISPVRYLKYGAHENQLSKSVLAIALQLIMKKYSGIHYFPAYEILLDELRDYRFYAEDMIHPSELAVKYIWERFKESYFEDSAINLSLEIESINRAFEHRPHFQETEEHQAFLKLHFSKVCDLEKRYPYLNFSEEKKYFSDFH